MVSEYTKVGDQPKGDKCPVIKIVDIDPTAAQKPEKRKGIELALCWLYLILILVMCITLVVGMWYESSYMAEEINWMSDKIKDAVNTDNWALSYTIYFAAQIGFHLFFLPGLTFWNALIGYYMENTWKAFLVVYIPSVISCFMTYAVVRVIFKNWCFGLCMRKRVFRAFFKESVATPWRTSWLVRCMFIPVATKNYMMPLLEVNFLQYAVPAAVFYIPYLGAMILVGKNLNEFKSVVGGEGWGKMNGYEKFNFIFTGLLGTATVLILVWFAWVTCKKMKELERKEKAEEERLAAGGDGDAWADVEKNMGTRTENQETQY